MKSNSILTTLIALVMTSFALCMPANAQNIVLTDTARVIDVQDLITQIPQQQCSQNAPINNNQSGRSSGGSIIGGIAGALLGSQVGQGNGKVAAAAVGGIVGALSGDRLDNQNNGYNQSSYGSSNSCVTRYVTQVTGYLVTFDYNGRQGQKRMSYHPGQTVRVTITVEPQ
jgi:uncharacterized protein YcfJ